MADHLDEARLRDVLVLGRRLVSCPEADLRGGLDRLRAGRDVTEIFGLMVEERQQVLVRQVGPVQFLDVQEQPQVAQLRARLPALLQRERMTQQLPEVLPASELWERAQRPGCSPEQRDAQAWSQDALQPVDRTQERPLERRAAWPRQ